MALDPSFLEELRNRVSLVSLVGRRSKLVRSGRNWKACCPFHGEKTPSFYVYDDHFHCFGCGVHGDAISFVMQSDGSSFVEAVERLAGEAGMSMPRPDPQAAEQAKKIQSLADILILAQTYYRQRLFMPEGRDGLAYLRQRGLSEQTLERFGLGWSGDGRGLVSALKKEGITPEQCALAGLMRLGEDGQPRGELFFNRVTFPIRDRKGRIISFGGRVLGDGQPKYLNGPETALFSKRRQLFNLDLAGQAVRNGEKLLVVEGYMDVIALDQAGLHGAVAPLGTALGEEQLALLWRLAPDPVLCLDGDAAGQRAALRACEVALPLLSDDKTLFFCRLEGGDDPDSLVRREGVAGMKARLQAARPMVEELFSLLTAGETHPGPERRTVLRKRLVELATLIPDKTLASEYRSTLLDLFFTKFRPRKDNIARNRTIPLIGNDRGTRMPLRSVASGDMARLRILTAMLFHYPALLEDVEQAYSQLVLPEALDRLRAGFLEWVGQTDRLTTDSLRDWIRVQGVEADWQDVTDKTLLNGLCLGQQTGLGLTDGQDIDGQIAENWWHFYGLVNFPAFEREVQRAVQEAIMQVYTGSAGEQADSVKGKSFPENVLAKMRVLEALRRGEKPELEEEGL